MTDKAVQPIHEFDMDFWSRALTPASPAEAWEMAEKWIIFLEL